MIKIIFLVVIYFRVNNVLCLRSWIIKLYIFGFRFYLNYLVFLSISFFFFKVEIGIFNIIEGLGELFEITYECKICKKILYDF